jgi:hypothetical protein
VRAHARPKPVYKAQDAQQQPRVKQLTTTVPGLNNNNNNNNMLHSNRSRLPSDKFNINDRVKCVNTRSKHYGHTALVIGMGKTRLHVEFENGHGGKFIDWRDAQLSPRDNTNATSISVQTTTTSQSEIITDNSDLEQLTNLMEHLAFSSATVISSNYADTQRMEELLTLFDRSMRDNARMIANTRRQSEEGTSPSSPPSS